MTLFNKIEVVAKVTINGEEAIKAFKLYVFLNYNFVLINIKGKNKYGYLLY